MKQRPFLELARPEHAYEVIGGFASLGSEWIDCRRAFGRVAAGKVRAAENVPDFARSNMDGFALRASDTTAASEHEAVLLRVAGQVEMGKPATVAVEAEHAVRVSTGAMMPPGADAVVMVEKTEDVGDGRVAVRDACVAGQNTIRIGEDLREGDLVFDVGRRFKGGDVGALTGSGHATVEVYRTPRVGIMATGDEIVEPGEPLGPGQVRNVNEYVLVSMATDLGVVVNDYGVVGDDERELGDALARAVSENDAVFISGGSSKGHRDLTRSAIEDLGDGEVLLHGIAIAPGKPTIIARTSDTAIMGLPGNPAAAAVVFKLFGSTLVRVIGGEPLERILTTRASARARLAEALTSTPGREDYIRARLEAGSPLPSAVPLRGKSAAISTLARADGLIRVPLSSEGLEAGSEIDVILL
ncbi:MAG: gephyrin-like molybdotransferase Glp [Candidatus Binatia bacterium]